MLPFRMAEYICLRCKHTGKPRMKKRGSRRLELTGWLLFPLGIPYTLWRMASKIPTCSHCDSEELTGRDSAIGRKLVPALEDLYPEQSEEKTGDHRDEAAQFFPPQRPLGTPNPHKQAADPEIW